MHRNMIRLTILFFACSMIGGSPMAHCETAYKGPIIDIQCHILPPGTKQNALEYMDKTWPNLEPALYNFNSAVFDKIEFESAGAPGAYRPQKSRLDTMGKDDIQIVSPGLAVPALTPDNQLKFVNNFNEFLSNATSGNPQFYGLALISAFSGQAGLDAARDAITNKGLKGFYLLTNFTVVNPATNKVEKYHVGDKHFEPFFELAEELNVPVLMHPSGDVTGREAYPSSFDVIVLGFLNDERVALFNLLRNGLLERHPDLKLIVTHMGGGILFNIARISGVWTLPNPPVYYLKKVYYDIASCTSDDISAAEKIIGSDHILVGTDFPWGNLDTVKDVFKELPFSEEKIRNIAHDNAERLFNLDTPG